MKESIVFSVVAIAVLLSFSSPSYAEINSSVLADSIRIAEGTPNYGILKKIKGNNYRKACIQTIEHAKRDFKGEEKDFIKFLGSRYAPTEGKNLRPAERKLNKNWVKNTTFHYRRLLNAKKVQR